jgi:hypothetical protein
MIKKAFWIDLDELWISIINIWSTWFKNISDLFHADRIRKKCAIITDEDKSIVDLWTVHDDSTDEGKKEKLYQAKCKNSEDSWKLRKILLSWWINDDWDTVVWYEEWNDYIKIFYAEHTFEIDWFLEDEKNKNSVKLLLDKIYTRQSDKTSSETKLNNPDKSISWREALRLADKEWKWWYAILLW